MKRASFELRSTGPSGQRRVWRTAAVACLLLGVAAISGATETNRWITDTAAEFLGGQGEGVAVEAAGRLVPVATWRDAVTLEEPVVMAGDLAPDGSIIVGTGHPARLYRIEGDSAKLLAEIPAEQVTAVLVEAGGGVVIATMAPGALFRWRGGEINEIGRVDDGGFWDLARFEGRVLAAAGPPAALYWVTDHGLERWVEMPDAFVRCLEVVGDRVLAGTSGKGLILSVDTSGRMGLVLDSQFNEISDLVAVPDGSVWATALVGEPPPKKTSNDKDDEKQNGDTETGTMNLDLPKVDGSSATSELIQVTPDGAMLRMHRWVKQVAATVAWDGKGVLVGTGYEGELWRFVNSGGARVATVDAVQAVAILGDGEAVLTQGPAQVLRRDATPDTSRFRSKPLNLQWPARFGRVLISPPLDGVRIRFRSGLSKEPDPTWLAWSDWLDGPQAVVPLPASRSLQWEVELDPEGEPKVAVERIEVAYREVNVEPMVYPPEVEEPGVIYLSGPPPAGPVIDVSHPDVSGIFTVIHDDMKNNSNNGKGKKYWRVGFRTVSWKAEDPNGDPLRFDLELENDNGFRLEVERQLRVTQLAVDTAAVPDGLYRFRLTATDAETNPGDGREVESLSPWFLVDNTPPQLRIDRREGLWQIEVEDASSPVARVEWSRDGAEWQPLAPADGLFDDRRETFTLEVAKGRHLVVVRAIDAQHNRSSAGAVER